MQDSTNRPQHRETRECGHCEQPFTAVWAGSRNPPSYCTQACKRKAARRRYRQRETKRREAERVPLPERQCPECAEQFRPSAATQKFCVAECRLTYYARVSADNVRKRKGMRTWDQYKADLEASRRTCTITGCAKPHLAKGLCRSHYGRARRIEGDTLYALGGDYRKRAEHWGVDYEPFDRFEVFRRDHWTCQLCGEQVDPAIEYPDPMSVSLDHIIPLSKGGPHTKNNAQTAHLGCNSRKGNRQTAHALAA